MSVNTDSAVARDEELTTDEGVLTHDTNFWEYWLIEADRMKDEIEAWDMLYSSKNWE